MLDTPDLVNMESKEFKELPAEVKHELLMEMQDYHRKRHKYRNSEHSEELPEVKRMSSGTVWFLMYCLFTNRVQSYNKCQTNVLF